MGAKWVRVTRRNRCPVCGHGDWCMVAPDGTAAMCPRTPSDKWVGANGGGYLHKITGTAVTPVARQAAPEAPRRTRAELVALMSRYRTATNPERLVRLAAGLGLTVESLKRLDIGWADDKDAWAFPMVDPRGVLMGIRLRREDGRKFAVTGGHEGLFIPKGLARGTLLLCEGPTSCAALLDLGFNAVGRPSCMSGVELVKVLVSERRCDVVIFGDRDGAKARPDGSTWHPGQDGARRLAQEILPMARSVKVVIPPAHKDPRDWKKAGATHQVIESVISAANYVR